MRRLVSLLLALLCVGAGFAAQAEDVQPGVSYEVLLQWSQAFGKYAGKFARAFSKTDTADLPEPSSAVVVMPEDADTVPLWHGEAWNVSGNAAVLLDAGMDDASLWRAALLYTADANDATILAGSYTLMMASIQIGFPYGTDLHALGELLDTVFAQQSLSAQKDGYVLVHQVTEDGSQMLAVESIAYFEAFDSNTIENNYRLE